MGAGRRRREHIYERASAPLVRVPHHAKHQCEINPPCLWQLWGTQWQTLS